MRDVDCSGPRRWLYDKRKTCKNILENKLGGVRKGRKNTIRNVGALHGVSDIKHKIEPIVFLKIQWHWVFNLPS